MKKLNFIIFILLSIPYVVSAQMDTFSVIYKNYVEKYSHPDRKIDSIVCKKYYEVAKKDLLRKNLSLPYSMLFMCDSLPFEAVYSQTFWEVLKESSSITDIPQKFKEDSLPTNSCVPPFATYCYDTMSFLLINCTYGYDFLVHSWQLADSLNRDQLGYLPAEFKVKNMMRYLKSKSKLSLDFDLPTLTKNNVDIIIQVDQFGYPTLIRVFSNNGISHRHELSKSNPLAKECIRLIKQMKIKPARFKNKACKGKVKISIPFI